MADVYGTQSRFCTQIRPACIFAVTNIPAIGKWHSAHGKPGSSIISQTLIAYSSANLCALGRRPAVAGGYPQGVSL